MKKKIEIGKRYGFKNSKYGLIPIAVDDEFVTVNTLEGGYFKIDIEGWYLDINMDDVRDVEDKDLK